MKPMKIGDLKRQLHKQWEAKRAAEQAQSDNTEQTDQEEQR
jgi:hypothetical protein